MVAGAGALGCYFAARFLDCGMDVQIIARRARLAYLRRSGLSIEIDGRAHNFAVNAGAECQDGELKDCVVFACKSADLPDMLTNVGSAIGRNTSLLSVQNGIEAPRILASTFPQATVLASKVHGFFELEQDIVRHVGVEPWVTFGRTHGTDRQAGPALAGLLEDAGIGHTQTDRIWPDLWEKLLLVSALGGVGAAFGFSAGQIMSDRSAAANLKQAMEEVAALADHFDIGLQADCVRRNLAFVAKFPAEARPSMQRDLEAGRPSEYASLCGAVLSMGQSAGVDVTTFAYLDRLIRAKGYLE